MIYSVRHVFSTLSFVLATSQLFCSHSAHAWGSYGHQQVNVAAVQLLGRVATPQAADFAACLSANRSFMARLAITPDVDWKMTSQDRFLLWTMNDIATLLKAPTDVRAAGRIKKYAQTELSKPAPSAPGALLNRLVLAPADATALRELQTTLVRARGSSSAESLIAMLEARQKMAAAEKPLHFFEADTFSETLAGSSMLRLPANPDYGVALPAYLGLISRNAARIEKMSPRKKLVDPAHPTSSEVASHGTAPWRVLQLYDLAVDAIKRGDTEGALTYLGIMGHYVGDMSQPFHGTLNFDGDTHDRPAQGIHAIMDDGVIETAVKGTGAKADPKTKLWSSFATTESEVLASGQAALGDVAGGATKPLGRNRIPREIIRLVAGGYGLIHSLLEGFADARAALHLESLVFPGSSGKGQAATPEQVQAAAARFGASTVNAGSKLASVLALSEQRIGQSAAILARLWMSAYADAQVAKLPGCAPYAFSEQNTSKKYVSPAYLPAGANAGEDDGI